MNKLIQIRGTNATGKTTAVRNLISEGKFKIFSIKVRGKEYPYTYDGEIVVGGRYDTRECGGLDGVIKDKNVMKEYVIKLLKELKPKAFILDAVMYGVTFRFAYELNVVCESLGYHYIGLTFAPPLDVSLLRLYQRNGGKDINVEHLQQKHIQSVKAYKRLKACGVDVRLIDTSKVPKEHMHKIIQEEL